MNFRKFTFLILFFFISALPSQALANPVVILGAAALGASLLATSAGTYYAKNGVAPSYVTATANAAASLADAVFQPSYFAQYAGSLFTPSNLTQAKDYWFTQAASVGMTIGNIENTVNRLPAIYPFLKGLLDQSTTVSPPVIADGEIMACDPAFSQCQPGVVARLRLIQTAYNFQCDQPGHKVSEWIGATQYNDVTNLHNWDFCNTVRSGPNAWTKNTYLVTYEPGTPPESTGVLDPQGLKNKIVDSIAAPSSTSADELRKLFASNPSLVIPSATVAPPSVTAAEGAPPAVTATQKADILKKNAQDVATTAANNAGERAAANPTDGTAQAEAEQAAVTASQQAADAAEAAKPEEEKFSSIASQGFSTAYDPGQFDIPARFTTFVNTVKSSPLFSFSNGFFNSLPGGGSPIYEIDAGQYGHHSVDLSQTMSTGLAVLKTILLACFGFLSIRAVIMKR